jgi:predicted peptidase
MPARLLVMLLLSLSTLPASAASLGDFVDYSFMNSSGTVLLPGRLYIPPEAAAGPRPIILFMHGAGDQGTDNASQINSNIDNLIAEAKQRGAYLYAPQAAAGWQTSTLARIDTMLQRLVDTQNGDVNRIYATGLSLGGGGTWSMMSRYPNRFAAGVPLAGTVDNSYFNPWALADQAIWAFHAVNDMTVDVQKSQNAVGAIENFAGYPVPDFPSANSQTFEWSSEHLDLHYTQYATGGHGIWPRVYGDERMYDWMFAHTLLVPEPDAVVILGLGSLGLALVAIRRARRAAPLVDTQIL